MISRKNGTAQSWVKPLGDNSHPTTRPGVHSEDMAQSFRFNGDLIHTMKDDGILE